MADWEALDAELDRWVERGRVATFWWRDDDATAATPALARLLALAAARGAPLALAVIPAHVDDAAVAVIAGADEVAVLQHGHAHVNHAAPPARKVELGAERQAPTVLAELARSRRRLAALFGARFPPLLVPPWNRVDDAVVDGLVDAGFRGLSTFGPRRHRWPRPGLAQVNTHIDIIDWHGGRGFVGADAALGVAVDHLRARRTGAADGDEPSGLMTHHLVHDEDCWAFVARFVATIRDHPAGRWLDVADAFGTAP